MSTPQLTSGMTSAEVLVIGRYAAVHVGIAMVTKDVSLAQTLFTRGS